MNNNTVGAFNVDEVIGEESVSRKRRLASDMNDNKSMVRSSFANLYNINKFTAGLNGTQKGLSEIAGEFEYLANIDQSFVNESLHGDNALAAKADELYISHDFVGNNSMEINTYNKSILGKIDGTSVNKGDKSLTEAHVDESTTIDKENLVDVTKGATVEQHAQEIDGITKEDDFAQINKESDVSVNKVTDETGIQVENLENISKEGGEQEQHIEEHYDAVQEKQLENITNGNLGPNAELQMNIGEVNKVSNWSLEK